MRMDLFQRPRVIETSSLYSKLSFWVQKGICDDLKLIDLSTSICVSRPKTRSRCYKTFRPNAAILSIISGYLWFSLQWVKFVRFPFQKIAVVTAESSQNEMIIPGWAFWSWTDVSITTGWPRVAEELFLFDPFRRNLPYVSVAMLPVVEKNGKYLKIF